MHVTLGESLKQVGRDAESRAEFELAETLCRPMAAQHPNDPQVAVAYGFVLWRLHRLDEAEGQLARAIALNPQLADAYCSLGYVLRDKSRAADARKEFEACLRLNPAYAGRPEIEQWLASKP